MTTDEPVKESEAGRISPWSLTVHRFTQHRLALGALFLLIGLYAVALLADVCAPYPATWRDLNRTFCPPQLPRFSFKDGLHVLEVNRSVDPVTLRVNYWEQWDRPVGIHFFVHGETYQLWGLISSDRHLVGVGRSSDRAATTFFLLGSDRYGRDICSRIIFGSRVSLSIGLVAIAVTFVLGVTVGGISGYVGGKVDTLIQRVIEIVNAFPQVPLWLALGAALPPDWSPLRTYFAITIVLSLLGWTGLARVVRGKILALREEDYALAARLVGASHGRLLFRHLLPGVASHILVVLTLSVPGMILGETSLSFLNLGLRPPVVSWGVMLQDCLSVQTVANYPWLLSPVVFIIATVLSFNFLGDGLRDAADPYASR